MPLNMSLTRGDLVQAESRGHRSTQMVTATLEIRNGIDWLSPWPFARASPVAETCDVALYSRETFMFTAFIVLLWISLVVGTYATGNVAGNWLVCLLGVVLF